MAVVAALALGTRYQLLLTDALNALVSTPPHGRFKCFDFGCAGTWIEDCYAESFPTAPRASSVSATSRNDLGTESKHATTVLGVPSNGI